MGYNSYMDLRLKVTDYEMTPETSAYLDAKLEDIGKLLGHADRCEVELGRAIGHSQQGKVWKAEIVVLHEGDRFRAIAQEESVTAAIDIVKDEILQQLRKHKGRTTTMSRRVGLRIKNWMRFGKE